MTYSKNCLQCETSFSRPKKTFKFCSRICYSEYRKVFYRGEKHPQWKGGLTQTLTKCQMCHKSYVGYFTRKFCSPECSHLFDKKTGSKRRENNGMWKGGRCFDKDGYVLIKDDKSKIRSGYILEHRYVMEQALGRKLKRDEVVHHKNHNKSDNCMENLELMTKRKHDSMHLKEYRDTGRNIRIKIGYASD